MSNSIADSETTPNRPVKSLRQFFHPVALSDEVTQGLNTFPLLGEDVLVYRGRSGEPIAVKDLCIHRGTRLSLGELTQEGTLRCAYHGWEYDEAGTCVRIPALPPGRGIPSKARAFTYDAVEAYDAVWVAMEEPIAPVPSYPGDEWNRPGWRSILLLHETWTASAGRVLENFCDWAHLPWVHENLLGTRDQAEVQPYEVWQSDLQLGFTIEQEESLGPEVADCSQRILNAYRVELPFTVYLDRGDPEGRNRMILQMSVTPITAKKSTIFLWLTRNHLLEAERDQELKDFNAEVLHQDKTIVESQRPEEIPLSLREEMHIKVPDAFSVVYRRLLNEFGDEETELFLKP